MGPWANEWLARWLECGMNSSQQLANLVCRMDDFLICNASAFEVFSLPGAAEPVPSNQHLHAGSLHRVKEIRGRWHCECHITPCAAAECWGVLEWTNTLHGVFSEFFLLRRQTLMCPRLSGGAPTSFRGGGGIVVAIGTCYRQCFPVTLQCHQDRALHLSIERPCCCGPIQQHLGTFYGGCPGHHCVPTWPPENEEIDPNVSVNFFVPPSFRFL